MSYTELMLVRHAKATHNLNTKVVGGRSANAELIDDGAAHGVRLGLAWSERGYAPQRADTSPLARARRTLEIALDAALLHLPIRDREELAEHCWGQSEGRPLEEAYGPGVKEQIDVSGADYVPPGYNAEKPPVPGQSLRQVAVRMGAYVVDLRRPATPPESVVAMSHDMAMRCLLGYLQLDGLVRKDIGGVELHEAIRSQPRIANCAETLLVVEGGPELASLRIGVEFIGREIPVE